jgi:hypothetical protein
MHVRNEVSAYVADRASKALAAPHMRNPLCLFVVCIFLR